MVDNPCTPELETTLGSAAKESQRIGGAAGVEVYTSNRMRQSARARVNNKLV